MKHIPLRTCLITRKKLPKDQLARFVIDPESGTFRLDEHGKIRSRGANLSLNLGVYDIAVQKGAFDRALKSKIPRDELEATRDIFEKFINKVQFRAGRKKVSIRVQGEKVKLD